MQAGPRVFRVDGSGVEGAFPSIAAAVKQCGPGDVVEVAPGMYTQQLNIAVPVTIRALHANEPLPHIASRKTVAVRVCGSAQVRLENLVLQQLNPGNPLDDARKHPVCVRVVEGGKLTLVSCVLRTEACGAMAVQDSEVQLKDCKVEHSGANGDGIVVLDKSEAKLLNASVLQAATHTGHALRVQGSARVMAQSCAMRGGSGVCVEGSAVLRSLACRVQDSAVALKVLGDAVVDANAWDIKGCGVGIFAYEKGEVKAVDCSLSNSRECAVAVCGKAKLALTKCEVRGTQGTAVYCYGNSQPSIRTITIADTAGRGIVVRETSKLTLNEGMVHTAMSALAVADNGRLECENTEFNSTLRHAACFSGTSKATLRQARLHGAQFGVLGTNKSEPTLVKCEVVSGWHGVLGQDFARVTLQDCSVVFEPLRCRLLVELENQAAQMMAIAEEDLEESDAIHTDPPQHPRLVHQLQAHQLQAQSVVGWRTVRFLPVATEGEAKVATS